MLVRIHHSMSVRLAVKGKCLPHFSLVILHFVRLWSTSSKNLARCYPHHLNGWNHHEYMKLHQGGCYFPHLSNMIIPRFPIHLIARDVSFPSDRPIMFLQSINRYNFHLANILVFLMSKHDPKQPHLCHRNNGSTKEERRERRSYQRESSKPPLTFKTHILLKETKTKTCSSRMQIESQRKIIIEGFKCQTPSSFVLRVRVRMLEMEGGLWSWITR